MPAPSPQQIESFTSAAMVGLRHLEAREGKGRRFGQVADDSWAALGGELEDRDRLDLLLRDASVSFPYAFAPRAVFAIPGLADDEPFGPGFPQAPRRLASDLLKQARTGGTIDGAAVLTEAAARWGLPPLADLDALTTRLGHLGPATRLVVTGGRAIAALSRAAASHRDLDLADQVLLVATTPAERQLFGLALALAGTRTPAKVVAPAEVNADLAKRLKITRIDTALLGRDAVPAARAAAHAFALELGAADVIDEAAGG